MSQTFTNPLTNRVLFIKNNGKTSPTLIKLLKEGRTDLLTNTAYLWNSQTKRLVERSLYYRNDGQLRAKTTRDFNVIDNAVYKKIFKPADTMKYTYPADDIRRTGVLYDLVYNKSDRVLPPSVRIIARFQTEEGIQTMNETYDLKPIIGTGAEAKRNRANVFYANQQIQPFEIKPNTNVKLYWDSMTNSNEPKAFIDITIIYNTTPLPDIPLNDIVQYYLDSAEKTHCVITPIIESFQERLDAVKSKASKSEYNTKIRKLTEFLTTYKNGCCKTDLQTICDELRISIYIKSLVCKQTINVVSANVSRHEFKFINNRMNHVEPDVYYHTTKEPIVVSDITPYIKEHTLLYGSTTKPKLVITPNNEAYKQYDEFGEVYDEFLQSNNLKPCVMINNESNSCLNSFIARCQTFTSHLTFKQVADVSPNELINDTREVFVLNNQSNYKEVDLQKAYTQYKNCAYYDGMPTVFTQYGRFEMPVSNPHTLRIGYYAIKNISFENAEPRARYILEKANFTEGIYILPILKAFYDVGVRFDILGGAWCHTATHFDLSQYTQKINGVPAYSQITGRLGNVSHYSRCYVKCSPYDAVMYQAQLKENEPHTICRYYEEEQALEISRPRRIYKHYSHIAGYITGYCFLNVFAEMMRLPSESLVMLKLDSIVYDSSLADGYTPSTLFHYKQTKIMKSVYPRLWSDSYSINDLTFESVKLDSYQTRIHLFNGAGGTGKTHIVLSDKSFYGNTLYASKAWILGVDKHKTYGTRIVSLDKLLGRKTEAYDVLTYGTPSVIICDEATQFTKHDADAVIEKYPYSLIIFIGDIDPEKNMYYQCDFDFSDKYQVIDSEFIKKHDVSTRTFTKSYRIKEGDVLLPKLSGLRDLMTQNVPLAELKKYVKAEFKSIDALDLYDAYQDGDYAIVSTKEQCQAITNAMKSKLKNRWICVRHSQQDLTNALLGLSSDLHGTIKIQDEKPTSSYELQHAFTIHSFQGKTINHLHKIFIDMNRVFNYQQLYTALSRAECYEQITLVC